MGNGEMDNSTSKKLSDWIRRQLFHVSDSYGKCIKIVVRHVNASNKQGGEVGGIKVSPDAGPDDIESICTDIYLLCENDAEGLGGLQKYLVQPYFADSEKPVGRFILRIAAGDSDNEEEPIDSEPATPKGVLSQLMRHQEAIMRSSVAGTQTIVQMQNRIIQRQAEQIENMQAKHIELIDTLEELRNEKHSRDIETRKAEFRERATQDIVDKVLMLAPNIVNKLGGKKLLPEKTTPIEQMIVSLVSTIKPEQFEKLTTVLTADQQMTLFATINAVREQEETRKKEVAQLTSGKNGKAD